MNINHSTWTSEEKNIVHPYYNDGYDRYDLSVNDIIEGLKNAGYDLDGNDEGNWWEDDDLLDVINYRLEILSSNVTVINDSKYENVLSAKIYVNNKDVTDTIPANCFKWSRVSGNSELNKKEDAEFNLRFSQGAKEILITSKDVNRRAMFQCQFVRYNDEVEWVKNAYSTYINLVQKESDS